MQSKKVLIKNDVIVVLILLFVALFLWLFIEYIKVDGKEVVISINGEEVDRIPLDKNNKYTYKVGSEFNVIEIKDKKVKVIEATCINQICVNHREISKVGETIICLPHKLVVEISE